jgi:hypothetical protein
MASPSYRERLTLEGGLLAASGLVGSAALLAFVEGSRENPLSTGGQLAFVAGLCAWLGPRSARRWTDRAESIGEDEASRVSGDPTPLWQLPAITAGLSAGVALLPPHMWDAALRVTGGCALVGATQALVMAPLVRAAERRRGGRFVRLPGSRLLRGTRLGLASGEAAPPV